MTGLPIWREVIEHQPLPPAAVSALVRARMAGAEFADLATVYQRGGHFCAEFHFLNPIGPERQRSVIVMLGIASEKDWLSATKDTIQQVERGGEA